MALSATCIFEIETGGSNTANGGFFDPGQTAGMATDGAVTNGTTGSPILQSASYNFVAGDVNSWVYLAAGTNVYPGWYQIASVAVNQATLYAAIGQGVQQQTATFKPFGPITSNGLYGGTQVAGCASVTNPTSITWTIDRSQQSSPAYSLTGLTSSGAGAVILTSSASVDMVGNGLVITNAGTGGFFTTGYYTIQSVSVGVSITVDRNCCTGIGAAGAAAIGGAFVSLTASAAIYVAGNTHCVKAGTYSKASATTFGTNGTNANPNTILGYHLVRGDFDGTQPLVTSSAGGSVLCLTNNSSYLRTINMAFSSTGAGGEAFWVNASNSSFYGCTFNGSVKGLDLNGASDSPDIIQNCYFTGNSTCAITTNAGEVVIDGCTIYNNSGVGILTGSSGAATNWTVINTILSKNSYGAQVTGSGNQDQVTFINCDFDQNMNDGFKSAATTHPTNLVWKNNACYDNGGYGIDMATTPAILGNANNWYYLNGSQARNNLPIGTGDLVGTAAPWTGAGAWAPNTMAGGGAMLTNGGEPGAFFGTTTTSYTSIGAVQNQVGSSTIFVQSQNTQINVQGGSTAY